MRLYYYDRNPNFGDALNGWLWERVLPGAWDPDDGIDFCGIGTIIHAGMPQAKRWIVFTSGAGYGGLPPGFGDKRWTVVSVRGPLTARVLGLSPDLAVSDGALLLATLPDYAPMPEVDRHGVVFVPHYDSDADGNWRAVCAAAGVEYLSPRRDSRVVVERLRRAKLVLADAMHAAIVADTLRVPWLPVVTASHINTFKWLDWTQSMDVPYEPRRLPSSSVALGVRSALGRLSGRNYHFDLRDDPVSHFARWQTNQTAWQAQGRKLARRLQRRAAQALRHPAAARGLAGLDAMQKERAAAALAAAARNPGFLSRDATFADRRDTLADRLEAIRRMVGSRASELENLNGAARTVEGPSPRSQTAG